MPGMPLLKKVSHDSFPTASDITRANMEHEGLGIHTRGSPKRNISASRRQPMHVSSQTAMSGVASASDPRSIPHDPVRLVSRVHTSPLNQSSQSSIPGSSDSLGEEFTDGDLLTQPGLECSHSSVHSSSKQGVRLSLHIHDGSFTRSPAVSQTNISGRTSFGYSRENGSTLDTTSPVSRSSLDFVFRSKTRSSMDPIARAATVQAARQAFEEKEAAKTWRFEAQQLKAERKQNRQKERHWRNGLDEDDVESTNKEKPAPEVLQPSESPSSQPGGWKSQSKNTWVLFLTWLRTRVFKLRRKIRRIA
ncbi:uncharacterized protein BO97DRAFT_438318 [Aspergillus homomorphus CBS 101889]|uniref:Uncharacterized protein n=1 Tax=Aspergillus homomorphus (strain CBS 101889) TaxID=1450537 RepID=A0A395HJD5_ASPHC|nr:hypothetical protein BO97DRAFT_438318 [Aspergillus homomorphus CBS 101889]RAL07543.1 hypothetical protein BO97DRAFT_438318 [Aspergillus homomorphus CBS 101889]